MEVRARDGGVAACGEKTALTSTRPIVTLIVSVGSGWNANRGSARGAEATGVTSLRAIDRETLGCGVVAGAFAITRSFTGAGWTALKRDSIKLRTLGCSWRQLSDSAAIGVCVLLFTSPR